MIMLTKREQEKFLNKHLRHRLTLLRTLRERNKVDHNYQGKGDIYRCVKDSNLMAVRLLLDFLGLKGRLTGRTYSLITITSRWPDDIKIDNFGLSLVTPANVPKRYRKTLAGVYLRADKELAHLTSKFNNEFNKEAVLIKAATFVELLLEKFLYAPLGKTLPTMDT